MGYFSQSRSADQKKWRKRNLGSLINFYLKYVFSLKYLLLDSIRLSQMRLCLVLLKAFSLLVFQYNLISSLKSSYFLKICHEKRLDKIQATVGMFKNTPTVAEIGEKMEHLFSEVNNLHHNHECLSICWWWEVNWLVKFYYFINLFSSDLSD